MHLSFLLNRYALTTIFCIRNILDFGTMFKDKQICNYLYNIHTKMFEVFKDECREVRLKSNAVMKVWLRISIPVFFQCDFLFPWRSENQKYIYIQFIFIWWSKFDSGSKANAITWDLKFELREGDIGNIFYQFRHSKCVTVLKTNSKSWWFSRNDDFSIVDKVAWSWILKRQWQLPDFARKISWLKDSDVVLEPVIVANLAVQTEAVLYYV